VGLRLGRHADHAAGSGPRVTAERRLGQGKWGKAHRIACDCKEKDGADHPCDGVDCVVLLSLDELRQSVRPMARNADSLFGQEIGEG